MTLAYFTLLITGILPVICAGIAKWGVKDYDNNAPRAWLERQTGYRLRANAAQSNSFEAFPFFAAAVLVAMHAGVAVATINALCVVFLLARIAYIACYVMDKASLRSLFWSVGYLSVIALFVLAMVK